MWKKDQQRHGSAEIAAAVRSDFAVAATVLAAAAAPAAVLELEEAAEPQRGADGAMDDETFAWCLFQEADADGSGGLDHEEVATLARNLGRPLSEQELNEAMEEMDEDGGGTVDFDEFFHWYEKQTGDGSGWAAEIAKGAKKYAFECIAGRQGKLGFAGGLASRMQKVRALSGMPLCCHHLTGWSSSTRPPGARSAASAGERACEGVGAEAGQAGADPSARRHQDHHVWAGGHHPWRRQSGASASEVRRRAAAAIWPPLTRCAPTSVLQAA